MRDTIAAAGALALMLVLFAGVGACRWQVWHECRAQHSRLYCWSTR